jgi:glycosylphosphatidylinositol transamidase
MQVPRTKIWAYTDISLASGLQLGRNSIALKLPPYLSFLCIVIGVVSLFVLPVDDYSRKTYISENALLPGQVHTYFAGSDQNVFRGYKHEVDALEGNSNIEYGHCTNKNWTLTDGFC